MKNIIYNFKWCFNMNKVLAHMFHILCVYINWFVTVFYYHFKRYIFFYLKWCVRSCVLAYRQLRACIEDLPGFVMWYDLYSTSCVFSTTSVFHLFYFLDYKATLLTPWHFVNFMFVYDVTINVQVLGTHCGIKKNYHMSNISITLISRKACDKNGDLKASID
jgi:hypothetical protein